MIFGKLGFFFAPLFIDLLLSSAAQIHALSILLRQLVNDGQKLFDYLLGNLTQGLSSIKANQGSTFEGGPFGNVSGVLDKFGLDFSDVFVDFMDYYDSFKPNVAGMDPGLQELLNFKPRSLSHFPNLLQIGSKKRVNYQYSPGLRSSLWKKLNATFPSPIYNGVRIPGLSGDQSFGAAFPDSATFPGKRGNDCFRIVLNHL